VSTLVRVLVWYRTPDSGEETVMRACEWINDALSGTKGFLGSELLRARSDPAGLLVMSEWESLSSFETWEAGAAHMETTASLRAYRDQTQPRPFEVYQVLISGVNVGHRDGRPSRPRGA
jgi:heme oxygenase (mycobilin-producing)